MNKLNILIISAIALAIAVLVVARTQEINYWKNKQGIEADFVIREGLKMREII